MRVGDLVSFKPQFMHKDDWSAPGIVLRRFESPKNKLWIVWCEGDECIVDEKNYEVMYLTSSLQQKA